MEQAERLEPVVDRLDLEGVESRWGARQPQRLETELLVPGP
jgi:hypothetical protein